LSSENQFIQNAQIPMTTKLPKIISGILSTICLVVIAFVLLPSFWFWVLFEFSAAILVAHGCIGEWYLHHHPAGRKKVERQEHHKQESRFIFSVALGVTMELFALAHSIREGVKLESKVSQANERTANTESNNLVLRINVTLLETSVRELVHVYGQSSNALVEATNILEQSKSQLAIAELKLAEANSRLASIRPIKDRLLDFFNAIDRAIIPALRSGTTKFRLRVPEYLHTRLRSLQAEPGSDSYVAGVINMNEVNQNVFVGFGGSVYDLAVELKPALAE
jgi:hypothetical protein